MKLTYIITQISGLSVAGRYISTLAKGSDGKRRISLEADVAREYVDAGWLVLDGSAPPAQISTAEQAPEYDFKGSTVRNARPPVNKVTASRALANPATGSDKGAIINVDSSASVTITLPADWKEAEGSVVRRVGTGDVVFAAGDGATIVWPASRATHTKIYERNSEVMVRVVSNASGTSAVWAVEGATA